MPKQGNVVILVVGVLGVTKLALEVFGHKDVITDEQINAIANGVGVAAAVVAAFLNNRKHKENK